MGTVVVIVFFIVVIVVFISGERWCQVRLELFERGGHAGMLLCALRHLSVAITLALLS